MKNCSDPYVIVLNNLDGSGFAAGRHLAELTREATIGELLENLGAECLEIRFKDYQEQFGA